MEEEKNPRKTKDLKIKDCKTRSILMSSTEKTIRFDLDSQDEDHTLKDSTDVVSDCKFCTLNNACQRHSRGYTPPPQRSLPLSDIRSVLETNEGTKTVFHLNPSVPEAISPHPTSQPAILRSTLQKKASGQSISFGKRSLITEEESHSLKSG